MKEPKPKAPENVIIGDEIRIVGKDGKPLLDKNNEPSVLGTKPIELTRSRPIRKVNMFLPPGVSSFYVERLDKNHIRFLIRTEEIERLAEKVKMMMKSKRNAKAKLSKN